MIAGGLPEPAVALVLLFAPTNVTITTISLPTPCANCLGGNSTPTRMWLNRLLPAGVRLFELGRRNLICLRSMN